jgi:hypothetical protein
MNGDARISAPEPSNYCGQQPCNNGLITSNPDLSECRVAEKLDIPHPLTQIVKHCRCAVKERTSIDGRLDPLLATIQETHANCCFKFSDCPRNRGLGGIELLRRLAHASSVSHSHENVEVLQPYSSSYMLGKV